MHDPSSSETHDSTTADAANNSDNAHQQASEISINIDSSYVTEANYDDDDAFSGPNSPFMPSSPFHPGYDDFDTFSYAAEQQAALTQQQNMTGVEDMFPYINLNTGGTPEMTTLELRSESINIISTDSSASASGSTLFVDAGSQASSPGANTDPTFFTNSPSPNDHHSPLSPTLNLPSNLPTDLNDITMNDTLTMPIESIAIPPPAHTSPPITGPDFGANDIRGRQQPSLTPLNITNGNGQSNPHISSPHHDSPHPWSNQGSPNLNDTSSFVYAGQGGGMPMYNQEDLNRALREQTYTLPPSLSGQRSPISAGSHHQRSTSWQFPFTGTAPASAPLDSTGPYQQQQQQQQQIPMQMHSNDGLLAVPPQRGYGHQRRHSTGEDSSALLGVPHTNLYPPPHQYHLHPYAAGGGHRGHTRDRLSLPQNIDPSAIPLPRSTDSSRLPSPFEDDEEAAQGQAFHFGEGDIILTPDGDVNIRRARSLNAAQGGMYGHRRGTSSISSSGGYAARGRSPCRRSSSTRNSSSRRHSPYPSVSPSPNNRSPTADEMSPFSPQGQNGEFGDQNLVYDPVTMKWIYPSPQSHSGPPSPYPYDGIPISSGGGGGGTAGGQISIAGSSSGPNGSGQPQSLFGLVKPKVTTAAIEASSAARRTNTKGDEFVCRYCSQVLTAKHNLTRHEDAHMGIKRYQCEYCNRALTTRSDLNRHKKTCKVMKERTGGGGTGVSPGVSGNGEDDEEEERKPSLAG